MKILVTGFDPFGGERLNPSFEVVKLLKEHILDAEIFKLEIPTAFNVSAERVIEEISKLKPDYVLCLGQSGGSSCINVERVAINVDDARIPDNMGRQPVDTLIDSDGSPAYFSTLPIKAIVEGIKNIGIPAIVSNSAGTYVCNHIMYSVLNHISKNKLDIKAGFIHIPFIPSQITDKPNTPSMDLNTAVQAIEKAIEVIASN